MAGKYLLGDMLSALRNKEFFYDTPVVVSYNLLCFEVLEVMKKNGYVSKYALVETNGKKTINVWVMIVNGKSSINTFKLISKPGRRLYMSVKELKKRFSYNPFALLLISTSRGVMSASDAIDNNIGGELLCEVF